MGIIKDYSTQNQNISFKEYFLLNLMETNRKFRLFVSSLFRGINPLVFTLFPVSALNHNETFIEGIKFKGAQPYQPNPSCQLPHASNHDNEGYFS